MQLTNEETHELKHLQWLKSSTSIPVSQEQFDRIKYLGNKRYHNECGNPQCDGYCGTDEETRCPKCKGKLMKAI